MSTNFTEQKIQNQIRKANKVTGKEDTDLIDSVNSLIAGYGTDPVLQEKTITSNGTYTADTGYDALSKVTVEVPETIPDGYVKPTGTITLTENKTYNITSYAAATVNVPNTIPEGYIVPTGELAITENGEHDVTAYAKASVNVPIPEGYEEWDPTDFTLTTVIFFTVGAISLRALKGDTWDNWIKNKTFNTEGFTACGDKVSIEGAPSDYIIYDNEGEAVLLTHEIIEGHSYSCAPQVTIISFTIDDVPYSANSNMSWETWVADETYNTGGYEVMDGYVYLEIDEGVDYAYVLMEGIQVKHAEQIIDNAKYTLGKPLIEFTIDGEKYYAYESMTFGEWVIDDALNTAGFVATSGYIQSASSADLYSSSTDVRVTNTMVIDADDEYYTSVTRS